VPQVESPACSWFAIGAVGRSEHVGAGGGRGKVEVIAALTYTAGEDAGVVDCALVVDSTDDAVLVATDVDVDSVVGTRLLVVALLLLDDVWIALEVAFKLAVVELNVAFVANAILVDNADDEVEHAELSVHVVTVTFTVV